MGKRNVDYGLLLIPCKSIHTFFMKINIDVVYFDKAMTIVDIDRDMKPWRTGKYRKKLTVSGTSGRNADKLELAVGRHL